MKYTQNDQTEQLKLELKAAETEIENLTEVIQNLYDLCIDGFATALCLWQVQDAQKVLKKGE